MMNRFLNMMTRRMMVPVTGLPFASSSFPHFLRRERRVLILRWRRLMLLPETVLVIGLLLLGNMLLDDTMPGQKAQAAAGGPGIVRDAGENFSTREVRALQASLRRDPDGMGRLDPAQLVNAFSYPDLERREGTVTVFQFRGSHCVLHAFIDDSSETVTHYEFRPRKKALYDGESADMSPVRARDCVDDILKSRRI